MDNKSVDWQQRFGLTTCRAEEIEQAISPTAVGVAVIYEQGGGEEKIFLVVESRVGSLRSLCAKRLKESKLPPVVALTVSFLSETLRDDSPATADATCRQQVKFAAELRRELRPAMR